MNELTVAVSAMPTEAAGVTRPAASLTRSFWYPHALRLGAYLPESVRQVARRGLAADGMRDVRRFRLPSGRARVGGDLVLEKRYLRSARFRAVGGDPHFLLDVDPVDAESVQAIRFNIWCSHAGFAFAQVYWRGESDTTFNEDRSVTVRLDGHQAKWQEYVVRLDNHERAPAWYESGSIVALRFDPINVPGPVCVGELALCKASAAS